MADNNTQIRIAIITGAAQGIGKSIALRLANDGLDVVINDMLVHEEELNSVAEEVRAIGRRAATFIGDVSQEDVVKALVEKAVAELGGVDVMVANAGIARGGIVVDMDVDTWDRIMAINVRGPMLAYKYAAQQMIKQGRGGRLIAASSICGKKGARGLSAYCASKFAVRGLTQSTAIELGEHKITVNAYAPGLIKTPLVAHQNDGGDPGSVLKQLMGIEHARMEEPEVVASLVSYLVKPESHFITGQTITVDGGLVFD